MQTLLESGKILFGKDEDKIIELKVYAEEYADKLPSVIILDGRVGAYELKDLFPEALKIFDYPKPVDLIKQLFSYVTKDNDIILDSFAGSGTTAQAVLELNKEDGGNRRFVLTQLWENDKQGQPFNVCEIITAERVRRVINGVPMSKKFGVGTGGSFSYFTLGDTIELFDLLDGKRLPTVNDFARYLFYTATGETFDENAIDATTGFIGQSRHYDVYLIYKPDLAYLKTTALTLEWANTLPKPEGRQRLVFAPMKFVDDYALRELRIEYCQLPYEIYKLEA